VTICFRLARTFDNCLQNSRQTKGGVPPTIAAPPKRLQKAGEPNDNTASLNAPSSYGASAKKNQQRAEQLEAGGLRRQRRIHALADPTKVQTFECMEDASDAQERMPGRSRRGGLGTVTTVTTVTKATRPPKSIVG
jgi:hypothetical protein